MWDQRVGEVGTRPCDSESGNPFHPLSGIFHSGFWTSETLLFKAGQVEVRAIKCRAKAKEKHKSRKNYCGYQIHIPHGWHLSNNSTLNCFVLAYLQWVVSSEMLHIMKDCSARKNAKCATFCLLFKSCCGSHWYQWCKRRETPVYLLISSIQFNHRTKFPLQSLLFT